MVLYLKRGALGVIVGILSFLALHWYEVRHWETMFGGQHEPWFLNSGRSVAFTAGGLFVVALTWGAIARGSWPDIFRDAIGLLLGVGIAMTTIVVNLGSTLFPIVLGIGLSITGVAIGAGLAIGRAGRFGYRMVAMW